MLFLTPIEEKALQEFSSRIKVALADNLREIKFFGSKSTGKFRDESDILNSGMYSGSLGRSYYAMFMDGFYLPCNRRGHTH